MSAIASRIAAEFAAASRQPGARPLDERRRRGAMEALTTRGLPTSRDENWKYANLRALEKVRFTPARPQDSGSVDSASLPAPIAGYARYTFIDGILAPALCGPCEQPGMLVSSMGADDAHQAALDSAAADADNPDLRLALLNEAFALDGAAVRVRAAGGNSKCLELVFVATAAANVAASYPRIDCEVEAGGRLGLIERHLSLGNDATFVNSTARINIGRDARVQHYRVQQSGRRALWFGTLQASVAERAQYGLRTVNLGAISARSTARVRLAGAHAETGLYEVSVGDGNQVLDSFALVEHVAPDTRTEQTFRGISAGRARVACNGKIVVRGSARGADSRQSLRGLLAGADAEIDVRPQLEIYTDEVRCSHGATAGKLDETMLFYLLSRGLERETALRVLKWAFLEDVVAHIEIPELRRQIEQSLAGQLRETADLKELL